MDVADKLCKLFNFGIGDLLQFDGDQGR
ncbi:hypothetical protein [Vreelandella venusta]|nr:hypothetical protein [Halomonas hydrothermalis]